MTDASLAVVFGLITAIGWGSADFWAARASKVVGPITTLLLTNVIIVILYLPVYPFLPKATAVITVHAVTLAGLAGLLITGAAILFYKGMVAGPVSTVSAVAAAYPLFTALLATFVFKTHLSVQQITAIFVIVIGVMAVAGLFNKRQGGRTLGRGPLLGMLAAVLYGVGFGCLAQSSERMGWQQTSLVEFIAFGVAAVLLLPFVEKGKTLGRQLGRGLSNRFVVGNGVAAVITIVIFNIGLTHEHASGAIVVAVSACYPVLTVTLALRHFKEKFKLTPLLGAAAGIVGIVILSLG